MQNGVLFLHIHQGVQAIKNTKNLTSTSLENNVTAALTGSKNTKNLTSTSIENNVTAALTGSKNTKNLPSTSLENDIIVALPDSKCAQKPTKDQDDELANLYLVEILPHSRQLLFAMPCVYRLFPMFSSFSRSPIAAGDSGSHQDSLPRTVLRKNPLIAAQRKQQFAMNLDQDSILNGKNNGTAYANQDLGMEIQ